MRNGSEVFTCQTDMTKAFDMVRHSLLFLKLLEAGFPRIFTRIYMFIYMFQYANVRWNEVVSSIFSLCNGVRQGAILSGILYCFYVNKLFALLRKRRTGCWVNSEYHGIFGYSDDNWVLAPSLNGLQEMMNTIEDYCSSHNLKFSTDPVPSKCKTKCIAFLQKERDLPSIRLCGNNLPWVKEGVHLGNYFTNVYDGMTRDISVKRSNFIQKNCELLQEFSFAHPTTKFTTNLLFNCHFTGSPLWDLFGKDAIRLENTWNVSIRKTFNLPLSTHRCLIEPVSDHRHLKKTLIHRFMSFINQIERSPKHVPRHLLNFIRNDTRSITGNNIRMIQLLTDRAKYSAVSYSDIDRIAYAELEEDDRWRIGIIKDVIEFQFGQNEIENFSYDEMSLMLNFACTSQTSKPVC